MLKRLQDDCQLAIITLFGTSTVLGILPFVVYRMGRGDYLVAALDAAITVSIALVVVAAWRSGGTRTPALAMACINNVGVVASSILIGEGGLLWLYAVLMSNFFLLPRRVAAAVAVVQATGLASLDALFLDAPHAASFMVSALLVSALSWILAYWTERQRQQLEDLATHDPLTGLGNRRAMEQDIRKALLVAGRHGTSAGVMMIDIDHFKRVNDRHGHAAGDAVLVAFADLVRESVRKLDGVYRLGGEEFLVLLPGVTEDGLGKVATTLRTVVASRLATPDGTLTASLGTSMLRPGDTAATWLSRVDEALYRAKASGRDRVCSDREPAPEHGASRAQEGSRVATSSA